MGICLRLVTTSFLWGDARVLLLKQIGAVVYSHHCSLGHLPSPTTMTWHPHMTPGHTYMHDN